VKKRTKRGLVVGGAALAIVGGSGAALAANGDLFGSSERQAFLNDAAGRLNVSPSELQTALQQAFDDRIDAAVKAGTITKAQGDALKARAKANGSLPFLGVPGAAPFHRGFGLGLGPGVFGAGVHATLGAAATYLGIPEAQLRTQLESGKTLAQIAKAQGKSVSGLKTAMLDSVRSQLDKAVSQGRITKAQETEILAKVSTGLDDVIQNGVKQLERLRPDGLGVGPGGPRLGPGFFGLGPAILGAGAHATASAAATYLGMTEAQLRTQLESGKTLAQIAKAQGKSVSGLKAAMLDSVQTRLDKAVSQGRITKAQETEILGDVSKGLDGMIQNGVMTFGGGLHPDGVGPGPRFGLGFGFRAGVPGPSAQPPTLPPAA
jgi:ribosomal protein S20